jgi:hypothetical protein
VLAGDSGAAVRSAELKLSVDAASQSLIGAVRELDPANGRPVGGPTAPYEAAAAVTVAVRAGPNAPIGLKLNWTPAALRPATSQFVLSMVSPVPVLCAVPCAPVCCALCTARCVLTPLPFHSLARCCVLRP